MNSLADFDALILYKIALELSIPDLLSYCQTNKKFERLVCSKNQIWEYHLNKDFPVEKEEFEYLNMPPKELFKLLISLDKIKTSFNLEYSLFQIYNKTHLDLTRKNLQQIPKEIGDLSNLQALYMTGNKIKEIPVEIGNLPNLMVLLLSFNQIEKIPSELGNLSKLTTLELNDNKIKAIPKQLGNLINLKYLYLNNNWLKEIPKELSNLTKLKILNLERNWIKNLPNEIRNLPKLKLFLAPQYGV